MRSLRPLVGIKGDRGLKIKLGDLAYSEKGEKQRILRNTGGIVREVQVRETTCNRLIKQFNSGHQNSSSGMKVC